jgi:dGTPase
VAQVARRLAERLSDEQPELAQSLGGIDPDIVEAAALAHDLGHPPFGHAAEKELNRLGRLHGAPEGFEGNAQSFRIITRLAPHRLGYNGLNLTRATLNAVLKYPKLRENLTDPDPDAHEKFGVYRDDEDDFREARRLTPAHAHQSVEAAIMDYADDIAYSIHDLDDFYRAGLIPLETLHPHQSELTEFLAKWAGGTKVSPEDLKKYENDYFKILSSLPTYRRFTGEYQERARLRHAMSDLINQFISKVKLKEPDENGEVLDVDPAVRVCMRVLQGLVWHYVITHPRLATQQRGQRQIVESLFNVYRKAIEKEDRSLIPPAFREEYDRILKAGLEPDPLITAQTRLAIDIVASLSDEQATMLCHRLTGMKTGSVHDLLP